MCAVMKRNEQSATSTHFGLRSSNVARAPNAMRETIVPLQLQQQNASKKGFTHC